MKKGKIIFIVSAGHSGSTLLDLAIGSINKVFSCGEMMHLPWQILRGPNKDDIQSYCSCGQDFHGCPVWHEVITGLDEKHGMNIYEDPRSLRLSMHQPIKFGRSLPALAVQALIMTSNQFVLTRWIPAIISLFYRRSVRNSWNLADQICETTGSEYIVDSSKNIVRFLFLRMHRPDDIKLVVLKRDIMGVASSSHDGPLTEEVIAHRTNAWVKLYKKRVRNLLAQLRRDDFRMIRYGDFCAAPEEKLNNIAKWLNLPPMEKLEIDTNQRHLVAGNPIRHSGEIRIRKDNRWRERLTEEQIKRLTVISDDVDASLTKFSDNYV